MNSIFKCCPALLYLFLARNLSAQNVEVHWAKAYDAGDFEYPTSVITSTDGGLMVCGNRLEALGNTTDILVVHTDQDGNLVWQNTYGGEGNDVAVSIYPGNDNTWLVVGYSNSFGGNQDDYDIYLLKLDSSGDTIWTRTVGDDATNEYAFSSVATSDGNLLAVGLSHSVANLTEDVLLMKIDPNGDVLWTRTYGGENSESGRYVVETDDHGFLITGETNSFGEAIPFYTNVYLIRTDANGDSLWTRHYGNLWYDYPRSIVKKKDNSYIVSGWFATNGTEVSDYYALRVEDDGDTAWTRLYGGFGFEYSYGALNVELDRTLLIGSTNSRGAGSYDVYLVKIDGAGDTMWTTTVGTSKFESAVGAVRLEDGSYILFGTIKPFDVSIASDILLMRVTLQEPSGLAEGRDAADLDMNVRLSSSFDRNTISYTIPSTSLAELNVYNAAGVVVRALVNERQAAGAYRIDFDCRDLPSGVYYCRLASEHGVITRKFVLLK